MISLRMGALPALKRKQILLSLLAARKQDLKATPMAAKSKPCAAADAVREEASFLDRERPIMTRVVLRRARWLQLFQIFSFDILGLNIFTIFFVLLIRSYH
jgi:hypothetical protein